MKEKYTQLYDYMASSNEPKFMKVFGNVMNDMFDWFTVNKPEAAEEWLSRLESIRWYNYLTPREAEKIVSAMNPKAPWTKEVWKQTMENLGIATEESPYYNRAALWTTMNMVYSDSANTIATIMGKPLADIPAEDMVKAVHSLAIDKLKDADRKFCIRNYFGV